MEYQWQTSTNMQRILVWLTIVLILIYSLGYILCLGFLPVPSPLLNEAQTLALYTENTLRFQIGTAIMIFAGGWFSMCRSQPTP